MIKELDARDGGTCVADTLLYRVSIKNDSRAVLNSIWYLPTIADYPGSEVGIGIMQTGTCEVTLSRKRCHTIGLRSLATGLDDTVRHREDLNTLERSLSVLLGAFEHVRVKDGREDCNRSCSPVSMAPDGAGCGWV
jgi:hypothetical protein